MFALAGCSSQEAVDPPPSSTPASASASASDEPSASASDLSATTRTNNFDIYPGTGVESVSFEWDQQYAITESQAKTWKGVTSGWSTSNPGVYVITAEAGRSGDPTGDTYSWFQQRAPIASTTNAPEWCGNPGSQGDLGTMNFAFTGTLTINGNAYPVAIGQFNIDNEDNVWAYGGSGWQGPMCGTSFVTPDGAFALVNRTTGGGTNYSITINAQ
ncbi:MAG: hypothetical protein H6525_11395 [Actinobacteria bacterium]|nr:hypothetical protein [Actinomycetota bacterium]